MVAGEVVAAGGVAEDGSRSLWSAGSDAGDIVVEVEM